MTTTQQPPATQLQSLSLDPFQQPAVTAELGPVLIIGAAGSGKTLTLAARIKHLIDSGHNPASISCIATSSRNSEHLRQLLDTYIPDQDAVRKVFLCTYHHMASTLLRTTGAAAHLGISPHYTIWDIEQSIEVIQSLIDNEPDQLTLSNLEVRDIIAWDGLNKARWRMGDHISPKQEYWFQIIKEYNEEKKRQNTLDLNDLIHLAVEALESAAHIRTVWRTIRTRHLLADDFHDLSPIQYRLLQLITGTERSLTIAVDPNQSVYGWRGADPRLITKFKMDFTTASTYLLRNNHRNTLNLHNAMQTILEDEDMTGLTPANQLPVRQTPGPLPKGITYHGSQQDMNSHMLDLIEADVRDGRCQWSDIAILFRRRNLGSNFITQLVSRNIPYTIVGDNDGPDKGTTRRTIALLSLALNPWDTATFAAAATIESDDTKRGLNPSTTAALAKISRDENINLIRAAERYLPTLNKGVKTQKNLEYVLQAHSYLTTLLADTELTLPDLCVQTEKLSHGARSERFTSPPNEIHTSKLITMSRNSQHLPGETLRQHLARFLENIKNSTYPELQSSENIDPYAHNSGLTISSIHAAKGKQWKSVWLINTTDAVMPGNVDNLPTLDRLHEEQRLFYVGSSRATDFLTYIHSTDDSHGNHTPRSRFLQSLDNFVIWDNPNQKPEQA